MDPTARESTEPQFVGAYGWMRAELERRSGNVDPARAAVDDALDQIEYCSDDVAPHRGRGRDWACAWRPTPRRSRATAASRRPSGWR